MSQKSMWEIANAYIAKGHQISLDAAYGGEASDRGREMVREGEAFLAGLDVRLPEGWAEFVAEMRAEEDREHSEYLRLKAKFESDEAPR